MSPGLLAVSMVLSLLGSCVRSERLEPESAGPVEFGVYVPSAPASKAGEAGQITTDGAGGTLSLKAKGFGVMAYYSDEGSYSPALAPNFMYNEKVTYGTSAWSYSPLKYWPNEESDRLSFFAYAPWVPVPPSSGTPTSAAPGDPASGILSLSPNTASGDPTVTYRLATDPSNAVDLLWANQKNLTKQAVSSSVNFHFRHALSSMHVTAQAYVDDDAGKTLSEKTFILIDDLKISADNPVQAKLNLNSDSDAPNWLAEGAEYASAPGIELPLTIPNQYTYEQSAVDAITASSTGIDGKSRITTDNPINISNNILLIPDPSDKDKTTLKVSITYHTVSLDSRLVLSGYHTDIATTAEHQISFPKMQGGKHYTLRLLLSHTSVKFIVLSSDWEVGETVGTSGIPQVDNETIVFSSPEIDPYTINAQAYIVDLENTPSVNQTTAGTPVLPSAKPFNSGFWTFPFFDSEKNKLFISASGSQGKQAVKIDDLNTGIIWDKSKDGDNYRIHLLYAPDSWVSSSMKTSLNEGDMYDHLLMKDGSPKAPPIDGQIYYALLEGTYKADKSNSLRPVFQPLLSAVSFISEDLPAGVNIKSIKVSGFPSEASYDFAAGTWDASSANGRNDWQTVISNYTVEDGNKEYISTAYIVPQTVDLNVQVEIDGLGTKTFTLPNLTLEKGQRYIIYLTLDSVPIVYAGVPASYQAWGFTDDGALQTGVWSKSASGKAYKFWSYAPQISNVTVSDQGAYNRAPSLNYEVNAAEDYVALQVSGPATGTAIGTVTMPAYHTVTSGLKIKTGSLNSGVKITGAQLQGIPVSGTYNFGTDGWSNVSTGNKTIGTITADGTTIGMIPGSLSGCKLVYTVKGKTEETCELDLSSYTLVAGETLELVLSSDMESPESGGGMSIIEPGVELTGNGTVSVKKATLNDIITLAQNGGSIRATIVTGAGYWQYHVMLSSDEWGNYDYELIGGNSDQTGHTNDTQGSTFTFTESLTAGDLEKLIAIRDRYEGSSDDTLITILRCAGWTSNCKITALEFIEE